MFLSLQNLWVQQRPVNNLKQILKWNVIAYYMQVALLVYP